MSIIRKTSKPQNNDSPLEFIFSDDSVDAYDDVISQDGWDLADFRRNPIALLGHDQSFVIGKWKNVGVSGGKLRGHLELAPEGTSARIDEVRKLVFAKILKSCSVGFAPVDSIPRPGAKRGGRLYKKQILRECSVVAVGANSNALMMEAKALGVSNATLKAVFRQSKDASLAERQERARASIAKAKAAIARVNAKEKTWKKPSKSVALLTMSPATKAKYERAKAATEKARALLAGHRTRAQAEQAQAQERATNKIVGEREWQGQDVSLTWRGVKISVPKTRWDE